MSKFRGLISFLSALVIAVFFSFAGNATSAMFTDITDQALNVPFVNSGATLDLFPTFNGPPVNLPGNPSELTWIGGVAIADFDGDGWNDIFVTNGKGGANALYLNNGDGVPSFTEVAAAAGVSFPADEAAAAVAGDIDNDGDTDLYVANVGLFWPPGGPLAGILFNEPGPNRLFLNKGNDAAGVWQGFEEVGAAVGATGNSFTRSQTATLVDFDRDGDLDIYVGAHNPIVNPNFASDSPSYPFKRQPAMTALLLKSQLVETGALSFTDATGLLRNEMSGTLGADGRPIFDSRFNFAGVWIDVDNNGWPDLVQANDLGAIGLFRNEGGQFRFVSPEAGLVDVGAWMTLTPGDINSDGAIDFFATNVGLSSGIPTFDNRLYSLYLNDRDGAFDEVAGIVGLSDEVPGASLANPSSDGDTSGDFGWGAQMFDFDNDGDLDLFMIGNWWTQGFGVADGPFVFPDGFQGLGHTNRGHLFENRGTTSKGPSPKKRPILVDLMASAEGRAAVGIDNPHDARSVAVGDLNNNGFPDVVISNVSGRATNSRNGGFKTIGVYEGGLVIYKNNGNDNRVLKVRLKGTLSNRDGIGARVMVFTQGKPQVREVRAGEGHLGANSLEVEFGLGSAKQIKRIRIEWPSGVRQTVRNVKVKNQLTVIEIEEKAKKPKKQK